MLLGSQKIRGVNKLGMPNSGKLDNANRLKDGVCKTFIHIFLIFRRNIIRKAKL